MELRHIRYFLAVAEERNFTRAAKKVGIGQPPLSQQIRALEEELGAPLFHRLSHGAELTNAGNAFLPEARAMIAQAEQAKRMALLGAKGKVGRLRIGFTGSAIFHPIVPAILRAFRRGYPEVDLSLVEADTTRLLKNLAENELDAIFVRPGHKNPEGVHVQRFKNEAMLVVLPVGHPLAKSRAIRLSALAKEPFVIFPRQAGIGFFDDVTAACRRAGFDPILNHEAPQISTVGNLVAAELGISIVPASIAAQVRVEGIVYVPIVGESPVATLALATRPSEKSKLVRNFQVMASTCAGARPED